MITIIPARGGSKGLPRKNLKMLNFHPLIAWTIEPALPLSDIVIVSTDDEKIAQVASDYGADVIKRPKHLATDTADIKSVVRHVIKDARIEDEQLLAILLPTYPQRTTQDIEDHIQFMRERGAMSCLSRCPVVDHPEVCLCPHGGYCGVPYTRLKYRRQDRPDCFRVFHFCILLQAGELSRLDDGFYNIETVFYPLAERPIDIDTMEDLEGLQLYD